MSVMQHLRHEHQELLPQVERLRSVADQVGEVNPAQLAQDVAQTHRFLTEHLLPHARAEEAIFYPAVAQVLGAPGATATMTRDHVEVGRLTDELGLLRERGTFSGADATALRRVLYGLYALVSVHFAKEEEVYLPLLEEALSQAEADRLLDELGRLAHA